MTPETAEKKAIKDYFKTAPDVPNTRIYKECKKLFCGIPPETAHDLTIKILQNRRKPKILQEFIERAPSSLSAYAISICSEKAKMQALMDRFSSSISSVLFPEPV